MPRHRPAARAPIQPDRTDIEAANKLIIEHVHPPSHTRLFQYERAFKCLHVHDVISSEPRPLAGHHTDQVSLKNLVQMCAEKTFEAGFSAYQSLQPSRSETVEEGWDAIALDQQTKFDSQLLHLVSLTIPDRLALRRLIEFGEDSVVAWKMKTKGKKISAKLSERAKDASISICAVADMVWLLIWAIRFNSYIVGSEIVPKSEFKLISWYEIEPVLTAIDFSFVGLNSQNQPADWSSGVEFRADVGDDINLGHLHPTAPMRFPVDPVKHLGEALATLCMISQIAVNTGISDIENRVHRLAVRASRDGRENRLDAETDAAESDPVFQLQVNAGLVDFLREPGPGDDTHRETTVRQAGGRCMPSVREV